MRSEPRTPERFVFNSVFADTSPPEIALRAGWPGPSIENYMFLSLNETQLREGRGDTSR